MRPSGRSQRIRVANNLFEDVGGSWGAGILAYFIMALVIPENPYEIVD